MLFGGTKKKATKQATSITIENKGNKVIECGDKAVNLRKELTAAKIDVYPLASKVTGNCGGAGICGTCAVKVCKGMEFFNEPSKNEQNTLKQKKKPADQRLSCCSRISGPVTIKVKP
jgi:ferredoxin